MHVPTWPGFFIATIATAMTKRFSSPLTRCLLGVLLATTVAVSTGCSGSVRRAPVAGKVTLDGEPIAEGRITFHPAEGQQGPNAGAVILNGTYSIPASMGATVGPNRVEIHASRKTNRQIASAYGRSDKIEEVEEAVPAIYNDKTLLTFDIEPGKKNVADFELRTR
jgi:hypothetical protein